MCEYCEKGENITTGNNDIYETFISKAHFGYSLIFKTNIFVKNLGFIKYCPMCGRKLGEDK